MKRSTLVNSLTFKSNDKNHAIDTYFLHSWRKNNEYAIMPCSEIGIVSFHDFMPRLYWIYNMALTYDIKDIEYRTSSQRIHAYTDKRTNNIIVKVYDEEKF